MKIQLPERGQPLDIDYLYQMAVSINSLNDKLVSSKTLSSVYNGTAQQSLTTNQIRFYSTTKNLNKNNVAANATEQIDVTFDTPFTNIPIVTATIKNNDSSSVGTNAIVSIKATATSLAQFSILFLKAGKVDINLNIIAIGI